MLHKTGILHLSLQITFFCEKKIVEELEQATINLSESVYCFHCLFPLQLVRIFISCYIFFFLIPEGMAYSHVEHASKCIPDYRI